jgi:hypothetical protein
VETERITLDELCRAVEIGEAGAVERFRREVLPCLQTVIRRKLLSGDTRRLASGMVSSLETFGGASVRRRVLKQRAVRVTRKTLDKWLGSLQSTDNSLPRETIRGFLDLITSAVVK